MKINPVIPVSIVVVIIGGFFLILSNQTKVQTNTANSQAADNAKTFELTIAKRKLTGEKTISALQGQSILLKISSDEAGTLNINGVEKSVELQSGKVVELSFTPNLTGRFPMVLKDSAVEIGVVEVYPK